MIHTENAEDSLEALDFEVCQPQDADHSPEVYQDPVTGAHFKFHEVCAKLQRIAKEREQQELQERTNTEESVPELVSSIHDLFFNSQTIQPNSTATTTTVVRRASAKLTSIAGAKYSSQRIVINSSRSSINNNNNSAKKSERLLTRKVLRPFSLSPIGICSARSGNIKGVLPPFNLAKRISSPRVEASAGGLDKRLLTVTSGTYNKGPAYRSSMGEASAAVRANCFADKNGLASVIKRIQQNNMARKKRDREERAFPANMMLTVGEKPLPKPHTFHRQTSSMEPTGNYRIKIKPPPQRVVVNSRQNKWKVPAAAEAYRATPV